MFKQGDVVKIGNGSTRYTVLGSVSETITVVQSHSSGKTTSQATRRLNLVQSVQDVAFEAGVSVGEVQENVTPVEQVRDPIMPVRESMFSEEEKTMIMSDVDGESEEVKNDHRESSYGKAILFALNRLGKHVYAGTASNKPKRKIRKLAKVIRRNQRRSACRSLETTNAGTE